jgi:NADH:ubiquinone oxidoreductase subunit 6 (subunit J)
MDTELLYLFWPFVLAVSWAIFALSFVIVEQAPVMVLRVLAIVGFCIAAIFVLLGVGA